MSHRIGISSKTGERLLSSGATWDAIIGHDLYRNGRVDLTDVCDRLKDSAICDGWGPVYREDEVRKIIEECAIGSTDDLL